MPGQFHDFTLFFAYTNNDTIAQAQAILKAVEGLRDEGATRVGITYSANGDQTRIINTVYGEGNWKTRTNGDNQAAVIAKVEHLLDTTEYSGLCPVFRIIPITTMAYGDVEPTTQVNADLDAAQKFIEDDGHLLGWKNQYTPLTYAIGGGVTSLSSAFKRLIKARLLELHSQFPGSDIDGTALKPKLSSSARISRAGHFGESKESTRLISDQEKRSEDGCCIVL